MLQVVADNKYIAEMAQHSFDFLKNARDVASRTGHSFALGCLHKYVGSLGSSQHLHTSVSILLALAQDNASPLVQCWAAHALALTLIPALAPTHALTFNHDLSPYSLSTLG